ncbi:MAG TPA: SMP-30/gluconolactonase/LRE family protein [Bacteroidales bacterium]|jgi:gluconolactonase|nr:gluconolaconase [Bacteroidales bacterium]OQB63260.1 MAG: Gluconolactonase precursor [Bacteroidetes bacterium ADurb.Bin145]HOU01207.1 SMP-30/gluconolactonase/LRE family protein [Bacteroidales bacterium]HQG62051.1 SMP-30/gluconolactonase/LRE family protein [Bacteroidales bacterium]HQK67190.1 SMP-30/gluconolactonase/LRE family protein [Bacteroidales bacterium]
MKTNSIKKTILQAVLLVLSSVILTQCTGKPEWQKKNNDLINQYGLTVVKAPDIPNTKIVSNLEPAKVTNLDNISSVNLYPGVSAKLYWGQGSLAGILELEPNAQVPEEVLSSDRFVFVMEGSVDQLIDGDFVTMLSKKREAIDGTHGGTPRIDFVYLEKGSRNAVKAGPQGAKLFEVYSPVRLDYLQKAGITKIPSKNIDIKTQLEPDIRPNTVYDIYDLQYTELAPGANSRVITGKNTQISFLSMEPGSTFERHIHPAEQLMMVLRGGCSEIILEGEQNVEKNDLLLLPGNMVHGAKVGPLGCDMIDIFWPARNDYAEKAKAREAAFREFIPEDAKVELVIDGMKTKPGLIFTEGPKWLNGKLYFSSMYFDASWNGDPKRSATVEMDPDGTYRYISYGKMQTNGLYPYKGNLLACDMMGHRVVEMTTKGQIVKVYPNIFNGKPVDGPNDLVVDPKGGIYFTDPQFTLDPVKFQPGRAVYYITPGGKLIRVIEPNDFAMPNGIFLSPDGKTAFINNCYDDDPGYPVNSNKENYVWAYDIKEDGTLTNGRQFAKLFLREDMLDIKGKSSNADGMAIDKEGNIYVGTAVGLQIFTSKGEFIGIVNTPILPVSVCFGDDDMKTLYLTCYNNVYKIRTNKEGFLQNIK